MPPPRHRPFRPGGPRLADRGAGPAAVSRARRDAPSVLPPPTTTSPPPAPRRRRARVGGPARSCLLLPPDVLHRHDPARPRHGALVPPRRRRRLDPIRLGHRGRDRDRRRHRRRDRAATGRAAAAGRARSCSSCSASSRSGSRSARAACEPLLRARREHLRLRGPVAVARLAPSYVPAMIAVAYARACGSSRRARRPRAARAAT